MQWVAAFAAGLIAGAILLVVLEAARGHP